MLSTIFLNVGAPSLCTRLLLCIFSIPSIVICSEHILSGDRRWTKASRSYPLVMAPNLKPLSMPLLTIYSMMLRFSFNRGSPPNSSIFFEGLCFCCRMPSIAEKALSTISSVIAKRLLSLLCSLLSKQYGHLKLQSYVTTKVNEE